MTGKPEASVVIVGAGPSGLAISRQLQHVHGLQATVLDGVSSPADAWRRRYDRFRLNTCAWWSHLPGQRIPLRYGRWPSRDQMVDYFDDYVRTQGIALRLGVEVARVDEADGGFELETSAGNLRADAVIIATGNYRQPMEPSWPGVAEFQGDIVHSAHFRNAWPLVGRDVLVVGIGNSAADIAVHAVDAGARRVRVAIRTPPHLVRRSLLGLPADALAIATVSWPVPLVDQMGRVLRNVTFGDLSAYGLGRPPLAIRSTVQDTGRIPTLADELIAFVRAGRIEIVPAVERCTPNTIVLAEGREIDPDIVVAATGFRPGLEPLVGHLDVIGSDGRPTSVGRVPARPGLWFAGFLEPFSGPLREFRRQATPIAEAVATYVAQPQAVAPRLAIPA